LTDSGNKWYAIIVTIAMIVTLVLAFRETTKYNKLTDDYNALAAVYTQESAWDWNFCNANICVKSTKAFINQTDFVLLYKQRSDDAKYIIRMHKDQWETFSNQTQLLLATTIAKTITNTTMPEGNNTWTKNQQSS